MAQVDRKVRGNVLNANPLATPQSQAFDRKMMPEAVQSWSTPPISRAHAQTPYRTSKPLNQASVIEMTAPLGDKKRVGALSVPKSAS